MKLPELIPPEVCGIGGELYHAYREGRAAAEVFYDYPLDTVETGISDRLDNLSEQDFRRETLAEVAVKYQERIEAPQPALTNAERLSEPESVVVTGGQQTMLFGGPLMVLNKSLAILNWAEWVEEEFGVPSVPVFWLPDWDHDYEEISWVEPVGRDGPERLVHEPPEGAGDFPVDRLEVGEQVEELRERFAEVTGSGADLEELNELLDSAYSPGRSFPEAFSRLLTGLLGERGLVMLPASAPELAWINQDLLSSALDRRDVFQERLVARSRELKSSGFEEQVSVISGETLLFMDTEWGRDKLVSDGERGLQFKSNSKQAELIELRHILDSSPARFSPSALLKPVYECRALPVAVFLGGPSEVAYWAQSQALFEECEMEMPPVVPRPSALLLSPNHAETWRDTGVEPETLFGDFEEWLTERSSESVVPEEIESELADLREAVTAGTNRLSQLVSDWEPTLEESAEAHGAQMLNDLERFEEKVDSAARRKNEQLVDRVRNLAGVLIPDGDLMERRTSFAWLLARYGIDESLSKLSAALDRNPGDVAVVVTGTEN